VTTTRKKTVAKITQAYRETSKLYEGDEVVIPLLELGEALHLALAKRGWKLYDESVDVSEYVSEWEGAHPAQDFENEIFYETTSLYVDDEGILSLDFAICQDDAVKGAHYNTLEDVMADIEIIEGFTYGDPIPRLPNAAGTIPTFYGGSGR